MSDMRHGWLSPGTTDTDIDREAQGEYKPPFYCSVYERTGMHCAGFNHPQCGACAAKEYTWETTDPRDAEPPAEMPCKFETFSGECLHCGAGIDDECEYERERRRA